MPNFINGIYENHQNVNPVLAVYQCGWQKSGPSHSAGPGIWYHYSLHYVVKGKGLFVHDGREYEVKAGQCFVIHPNKTAFYKADEDDPWEYRWVNFAGTEARKLLEKSGITDKSHVVKCSNGEDIGRYLDLLYSMSNETGNKELAMIGYLYLVFAYLVRETSTWGKPAQVYLENAVEYIDDHCCYKISVEDVANNVGIERSYLYRIFKREMGCSVSEYIQLRKLENAKTLLLNTNMSTAEIANSLSFDSPSHFSKSFKNNLGLTPSEFRKENKRVDN